VKSVARRLFLTLYEKARALEGRGAPIRKIQLERVRPERGQFVFARQL